MRLYAQPPLSELLCRWAISLYRSWTPLTLDNGNRDDGVALFDSIDDLLPVALHPAKNRVLAVEPGGFDMGDKELRAIGVWPGVCHTQDARAIMPQLQSGCFVSPG